MDFSKRVADLSKIWKQASFVFPYFDKISVDWDKEYLEYIKKVTDAKTETEFHLLLAEFINLLGDGHTDYLFPKELSEKTGFLPFSLKYIGGIYYIDSIIDEFEEHLFAKIISINGVPFSELLQKAFRYIYHVKDFSPDYALHKILPFLLNSEGNVAKTTKGCFSFDLLSSKPESLKKSRFASPEKYTDISNGKLDIRIYKSDILYIKLDDFLYNGAAEEIRIALSEQKSLSGVILDLRENIGGMTTFGAKIAELFISGVFHACNKKTRTMTGVALASASQIGRWSKETIEKEIASGLTTAEEIDESMRLLSNTFCNEYTDSYGTEDNAALYSGPIILLTSRYTVSAAEDFVAMFKSNNRATIIGTETSGTTGTPLLQSLLCGGRIRICSVGYKLLDETEFIGCGIKPDIYKEISPEDFEKGFDSVLNYCLNENHLYQKTL